MAATRQISLIGNSLANCYLAKKITAKLPHLNVSLIAPVANAADPRTFLYGCKTAQRLFAQEILNPKDVLHINKVTFCTTFRNKLHQITIDASELDQKYLAVCIPAASVATSLNQFINSAQTNQLTVHQQQVSELQISDLNTISIFAQAKLLAEANDIILTSSAVLTHQPPLAEPVYNHLDYHQNAIIFDAKITGIAEQCAVELLCPQGLIALVPRPTPERTFGVIYIASSLATEKMFANSKEQMQASLNLLTSQKFTIEQIVSEPICWPLTSKRTKDFLQQPTECARIWRLGAAATCLHPIGATQTSLNINDADLFIENLLNQPNNNEPDLSTLAKIKRTHQQAFALTSLAASSCYRPNLHARSIMAAAICALQQAPPHTAQKIIRTLMSRSHLVA